MSCQELAEKLSAYADGELDGRESAFLDAHISECAACRSRLDVMRALQSNLAASLNESVESVDVSEAVMSAIPRARKALPIRWAWAGAACFAVLLVSVYLLTPRPDAVVRTTGKAATRVRSVHRASVPIGHRSDASAVAAAGPTKPVRKPPATQSASGGRLDKRVADSRRPKAVRPTPNLSSRYEVAQRPIRIQIGRKRVAIEPGRRFRVTTVAAINGVTLTQSEDVRIVHLEPDAEAASVQRPPLQAVRTPAREGGPG